MFIRIIVVHLYKQKQIIMSKTKYIKVSVSERRDLKSQVYFTFEDDLQKSTRLFDGRKRKFFGRTQPVEVLIEVPDREDEIREMLYRIQDLDILPEEIKGEVSILLNSIKK